MVGDVRRSVINKVFTKGDAYKGLVILNLGHSKKGRHTLPTFSVALQNGSF